ncbi:MULTISPECIES: SulP family inorganic anion transporter [Marinobacter]|uniref:SulP family inorganic anion transporter n=1 Tax=Marinobacter TaxID=2742 RepID=UPI001D087A90|nr:MULTISPECIES: sulfate permease [Marinobacter]MCK7566370.1 sulfate permease [Marinobacter xestospongiae]UDL05297.1 sulfate permease [Marinobacter sp. CA1]
MSIQRFLPCLQWLPHYHRDTFASDLVAAVVVTVMLIPQSLAYALLAGVPAEYGLYASILPLVLYGIFGTSGALSVAPAAVASLMTAAALQQLFVAGSPEYLAGAIVLSVLSGLLLVLMGVFRLGFLANFLSHPVISGFVSASGVIIATSQVGHLIGVEAAGHNLLGMGQQLLGHLHQVHWPTLAIGVASLLALVAARRGLVPALVALGLGPRSAGLAAKAAPVMVVALATLATWAGDLAGDGVAVVGQVPSGLPTLVMPSLEPGLWQQLFLAALLIGVVGFVESISIGQTMAAKRRQRIDPDQELVALGAANLGSGFSGAMPVAASFSRSAVNFEAGAATPAAGVFTAIGIVLAALFLTPLLTELPKAALAATIIVSVSSLVDLPALVRTWRYSRADFLAMLATILLTLGHSVEAGILAGVSLSIALFLYRTSRPHTAVLGRVPGTEHFRNVRRFEVETSERLALLRIDESLYFANARFLEETVLELAGERPELHDVVMVCPAINQIDASALESLEAINDRLADANVRLHLSEVKGPVMDRLRQTDFLQRLSGEVFLSTYQAWRKLAAA